MKVPFSPMHRGRGLLLALITLLCFSLSGSRSALRAAPAPATVRLPGHVPAALARAHSLGRLPGGETLTLSLALPLRDPAGADSFLERLYDPADPLYQHYITPDEFARRYSPTQQSYDAVAAFARAHGLTVTQTTPNRLLLSVSGSAAAVESAFGVHLSRYQAADGRVFHAPNTDPHIPTPLVGRLSSVIGLDNYALHHPNLRRRAAPSATLTPLLKSALKPRTLKQAAGERVPAGIGTDPFSGYSALTPTDIKAAYNLTKTTLDGTGQTLALYELDGYDPRDVAVYESAFKLRAVPLQNILVGQADGTIQSPGGQGEVTLDIEVMAALAPGATKILVYEGKNGTDDYVTTFNRIATDNLAKQISTSWGFNEIGTGQPVRDAENLIFKQMAMQGQSIYDASGDFGAYDDATTLSVDDPGSQPFMVGVGGTTLAVTMPGGPYKSESTWGDPGDTRGSPFGAGGGGGISSIWPRPVYQTGVGLSSTLRNLPDVALDADPNTGYAYYVAGQWGDVGGTSVAAPLWAAFTALVNQQRAKYGYQPLGFPNPMIYQIGKGKDYSLGFHDVNDNSTNLFYHATTGYDNATGWGSFNGVGLLALFAPAPDTTSSSIASVTLTPNPVVGGLDVTGTVTLVNPAPAGGATVTLTSTDAVTAPVPASLVIAAGQTSGTFIFTTGVTTGTTVTVTATYQGGSANTQLVILPAPVAIVPATLNFDPPSVNGGDSSQGIVTLTGPAPKGGLVVTLSSSDLAVKVPASVTVPAGSTSAAFTATTSPVSQKVVATLTATGGGQSVTGVLTVLAPVLEKLVLAPGSVPGGQPSVGTLTLTLPAPAGGGVVTLSSDNPAATVPATVTIPAGGTTTTFSVTTTAVPKTLVATIKATFGGLSQTARLEVRSARISGISVAPASLTGGGPATGTVTLDSPVAVPAGLVVSLSDSDPAGTVPATVLVPLGATTATFPITTAVVPAPIVDTLTATLDSISKTTVLTIQPIQATSLILTPSAVVAGVPSMGTVTVNAPAPPGGLTITLSQTGAAETLPATATIPAGATSGTFTIGTPTAGTATIAVVVGGQTRTASLTVTTAVGTSFPGGLNMISVPYDYSGQPLDELFGYAGVRLATYVPAVGQYAFTPTPPADSLHLGRGYFVRLPATVTLSRAGTPADATMDFSIPLQPGWNMIGDPFLVPISLSATHVSSASGASSTFSAAVSGTPLLLSSLLYSYSPSANSGKGGYVTLQPGASLQPGLGYWVYAYSPVSLVVPHPGQ